jgi:hypothetical protein
MLLLSLNRDAGNQETKAMIMTCWGGFLWKGMRKLAAVLMLVVGRSSCWVWG